jgi:hypothetical protein
MSIDAAYRAAGQAVAALWCGAPIAYSDTKGAVIRWPGLPTANPRDRGQVLAEIAITMAGVTARNRYGYGGPATSKWYVVSWCFAPDDLVDLAEAWRLVTLVDPAGDDDLFFRAWCVALDLMAEDSVWESVEAVAAELERRQIDGATIERIADRTCGFAEDSIAGAVFYSAINAMRSISAASRLRISTARKCPLPPWPAKTHSKE